MPKPSKTTISPAILVENVNVSFDETVILEDINFSVDEGDIAAFIGPNGSGKTTLVRAILGLVPSAGNIELFGYPIRQVTGQVSYVPQRFSFDRTLPITVNEFLNLKINGKDQKLLAKKLNDVGLTKGILSQQLGSLSGGQLQRVLIAQALLNSPRILFLDEPEAGIDIIGERVFFDLLKNLSKSQGITVVLVSHDIAMLSEIVDTIVCINKKLLCHGSPKQALTKANLEKLFGHSDVYAHNKHQHKH